MGDTANLPKNAKAISLILHSMGVEDVEPRAIHQLLDFTYRTTTDFLETALTYADHAGRAELSLEDLKLAIQTKVTTEFAGPPPRELLAEIAAERNKEPLPIITEKYGVRLPAERYCLTQPNYAVLGLQESAMAHDIEARPNVGGAHLQKQTQQEQLRFSSLPVNSRKRRDVFD